MFGVTDCNSLWWNEKDPFKYVWQVIEQLQADCTFIRTKNTRHARFYANEDFSVTNPTFALVNPSSLDNFRQPRLTLNVTKSCVDSLLAKICKNKVNVSFLTSGGSYKSEKQAIMLNKLISGIFYQTEFHKIAPIIKRDEFIFGTGCAHVYENRFTKQICIERVFPDEIVVDMNDAIYGKPQSLYRIRYLPKDYLKQLFPEYTTEINMAKAETFNIGRNFTEVILTFDAYHLANPNGPGRHIFGIETASFYDEEYHEEDYPFIFSRYTDPILGFFGTGIPEELVGIQTELNRTLMNIQNSMRLVSNPKVFIEERSAVNPSHFTSDPGILVKYRDTVPMYSVNPSVHPDQFQHVAYLEQKAYGIVGLSELTSKGEKPAGLNSGKALDTYHDIETERFSQTARSYEHMHVAVAKLVMKLVHKIYKRDGTYKVKAFSRKGGLEEIDFSEIEIDEDGYVTQCFPISDLPSNPTGKLKYVQEMAASGWIDQYTAMELFDMPDTERYTTLALSPLRLIMQTIEDMLDTRVFTSPEPFDNIALCLEWGNRYYCWSRLKKMDEECLELLRMWLQKCTDLMVMQQPKNPQQQNPQQSPQQNPVPEVMTQMQPSLDQLPIGA